MTEEKIVKRMIKDFFDFIPMDRFGWIEQAKIYAYLADLSDEYGIDYKELLNLTNKGD